MKSFFKAVATVTIFSIITRTLGFFFRIFLSRKLSPEGIGLFQMASSILSVFLTIIASGLPLTTAKMVTKYDVTNDLKKKNQVVGTSVVISLILATVCTVLIIIFKPIWNRILTDNRAVTLIITLIPSLFLSAIYAVFRGALWGQNDYFNCGLTELIEQIFRFLLTFILLININNVFEATKNSAIAFNLTCLISAVIVLIIYFKNNKIDFKKGMYREIIKSASPITGVRLANSFIQPITTLIIPAMLVLGGSSKVEAVSAFGVMMGMTFPLLYIPMAFVGSISMVLIPSISSMLVKNDIKSVENNIKKTTEISLLISIIFIPVFLAVGDLIGIILYNNHLSGALLQISAACIIPITLCNLSGSILNALNLETKSFINNILGSGVLLILLLILTPKLGISSVAISYLISLFITTLLNYKKINKFIPNLKLFKINTMWKHTIAILLSFLLGRFSANICQKFFSNFFTCVIGGGISLISVLMLIQILNIANLKDLINLILKKPKSQTE